MYYIKSMGKRINFDCTQEYGVVCYHCKRDIELDEDEFFAHIHEHGIDGSRWRCSACMKRKSTQLELVKED